MSKWAHVLRIQTVQVGTDGGLQSLDGVEEQQGQATLYFPGQQGHTWKGCGVVAWGASLCMIEHQQRRNEDVNEDLKRKRDR